MIDLVAFIGLGGVNNVFSHVSLILGATSSFFAKLLLSISVDQNQVTREKQCSSGELEHGPTGDVGEDC
jgi:hypothetical protein